MLLTLNKNLDCAGWVSSILTLLPPLTACTPWDGLNSCSLAQTCARSQLPLLRMNALPHLPSEKLLLPRPNSDVTSFLDPPLALDHISMIALIIVLFTNQRCKAMKPKS